MVQRRTGPRRELRTAAVAAIVAVWLMATLPAQHGLAAAHNVLEITPAGIAIDGSDADWDSPALDVLTQMFEAADPAKRVLANAYGPYDCAVQTFYIWSGQCLAGRSCRRTRTTT